MTYLPPMNGGRINATIGGNTAGAGALVSSGTMTLVGGNNVTLSQAGNAITISGAAAGAAGSNTIGMSNLGNTSGTTGVISGSALQYAFAGGNNVTLSQSINGSSGTVTISAASQTVQTQSRFNMTLTGNTAGVMAQVSSGTLSLAGGNNIVLSQNGNAVTVSASNQTVQTQNLHNVTLGGNTAGVMAQVSSGTLSLAGGNNITLSQNGNAVSIIGAAGGGGGGGIALYDGANSITSGTAQISGGGALTASVNGQTLSLNAPSVSSLSATGAVSISTNGSTISIGAPAFSAGMSNLGNTLGTSGTVSNQVIFAGGNNITLSQSTGAGGNTITIAGAGGGGGGFTMASYEPWPIHNTGTAVLSANTNTSGAVSFIPFPVYQNAGAAYLNVVQSMSFVTGSTSSFNQTATVNAGLYARGTGGNNTTLSLITSMSYSYAVSYNNSSITFSHPASTNTAGYTYSSTASAGLNVSSGYTGLKLVQFPFNTTLSPDEYFLGLMDRASSSSFNSGVRHSYYGNAMSLTGLAPIGSFSSAFTTGTNVPLGIGGNWQLGQGSFTSAGQTNLPSTVAMSAISANISVIPYIKFVSN